MASLANWHVHLNDIRKRYPNLSFLDQQQKAKKTYGAGLKKKVKVKKVKKLKKVKGGCLCNQLGSGGGISGGNVLYGRRA